VILKCCEHEIPLMPQNNPQDNPRKGDKGRGRTSDVPELALSAQGFRVWIWNTMHQPCMHVWPGRPRGRLACGEPSFIQLYRHTEHILNTTTPADVSLSSKTPGGAGTHTDRYRGATLFFSLFSSTPWSTLDPHHKQTGNCDNPS
jgi:hypothetical protein